jgi:hypothetical protein
MKCCICGPARNCGPFLNKVLENIEKIGSIFEDYEILIFYDSSEDDTLYKLKKVQQKNPRLKIYINHTFVSKYRTHRIAYARNFCLNYVIKMEYPFFIMMDLDDVNCKHVNIDILKKYISRDDWDGLSFNTTPKYYDIWGLSIFPYCFSYNHFKNNQSFYHIIQDYIVNKLNGLKDGELLRCISSFNGFSIYRTEKFLHCVYDGRVNLKLIPPKYMLAHMEATNSPVIYKDYGHVKGRYEDCEHRAFHVQAINKNDAKIMITKDILFG